MPQSASCCESSAILDQVPKRTLRNLFTGIARCCARTASGQATAPPSPAMNSRRRRQMRICPSRRPWGALSRQHSTAPACGPRARSLPRTRPGGSQGGKRMGEAGAQMRHTFGSRPYGSGEPPSRFGPSMRGDSRRPCVGVDPARWARGGPLGFCDPYHDPRSQFQGRENA